jgi:predicted nucleic acid-binding protein
VIVSNATPLIYLAKLGKLELLRKLFETVIIPNGVFDEVVIKGIAIKAPDAFIIERSMNEGWIKLKSVREIKELTKFGLHKGETEAIALAKRYGCELLVDQRHARLAARTVGVKARGTLYVLLTALKRKIISYDEYILALRELVRAGFRMSAELYLEALELGKKLDEK